MRATALACLLLIGAPAWAANFSTCILDRMPMAREPDAHMAALRTCNANFPAGFSDTKKGSGRGALAFADARACLTTKSKDTAYQPAAVAIYVACRCLYDKPSTPGAMCSEDFEPPVAKPVN